MTYRNSSGRSTHNSGDAVHVEAAFTYIDGKFTVVAANKGGLAWCDLWADIISSYGGYDIIAVYAGSHFTDIVEQLSGGAEQAAIEILESNDDWLEWAGECVSEAPSRHPNALRAKDVVETGRRQ